jgi:general transcription factor IIIA
MGAKPWACPHKDLEDPSKQCSASFDTKGKLGNHVATLHNGLARRRYICTVCVTATPSAPAETTTTTSTTPVPATTAARSTTVDLDQSSTEDAALLLNISQASFPVVQAPVPTEQSPESLRSEGMLGFTTHAELRTHISIAHPPLCTQCGYVAKRQGELRRHLREKHELSLEERKPWICGWEGCGQGFTKKSNLTTHTATVHQGLKPFLCEFPECGKRFGHKAVLARHFTARHTEKKVEPKTKKPRKKRTKAMGLAQMLTGYGYDESGRDIPCVVEGCAYRFSRLIDLRRHLGAAYAHKFDETQVEELMKTQQPVTKKQVTKGKKNTVAVVEGETEESESEWSIAGSDTEDEYQLDDDDE